MKHRTIAQHVIKTLFRKTVSSKTAIRQLTLQDELYKIHHPHTWAQWEDLSPTKDCAHAIEVFSERTKSIIQYGDYLSDRKKLWMSVPYVRKLIRKSPRTTAAIHIGVDISATAGSTIYSPLTGTVIYSRHDKFQKGGWGGFVVIEHKDSPYVFIFGHLSARGLPRKGTRIKKRSPIAKLGKEDENGGWWPHLHLQAVLKEVWQKEYDHIDGYLFVEKTQKKLREIKLLFPEPLSTIYPLS
jgi:murein DD-endopeptidase MepM/ murein hydrolase activator NlpD